MNPINKIREFLREFNIELDWEFLLSVVILGAFIVWLGVIAVMAIVFYIIISIIREKPKILDKGIVKLILSIILMLLVIYFYETARVLFVP